MIRIRQVANLLGYREPQILEVFKNTLSTKLYWILFPIEDLRQAVDTVKRILTKEKLDKQLTGQAFTSPFLSVRDGTDRRVLFNTKEETPEGIRDRMIEEITQMEDIITITEIEVDQEKGISQEITITAEIEVQAIVD